MEPRTSNRNFTYTALLSIRNEAPWIEYAIKMISPFVDSICIGRGMKSWRNDFVTDDGTSEIIRDIAKYNETPIDFFEIQSPESDEKQRNIVLDRIKQNHNPNYVFVLDPDEFYHERDLKKIFDFAESEHPDHLGSVHVYAMQFFKNMKTVVGIEWFGPVLFSNRKETKFSYIRNVDQDQMKTLDIYLCHMTAVKSDKAMVEKIKGWSHSHEVVPNWLDDVWFGEKPFDLHPVSPGLWPSKQKMSRLLLPEIIRNHPWVDLEKIDD